MEHNSLVSGYLKSTGIPRVDDWSTDPRVLGRHILVSKHRYMNTYGSMGMGLGHAVIVQS